MCFKYPWYTRNILFTAEFVTIKSVCELMTYFNKFILKISNVRLFILVALFMSVLPFRDSPGINTIDGVPEYVKNVETNYGENFTCKIFR